MPKRQLVTLSLAATLVFVIGLSIGRYAWPAAGAALPMVSTEDGKRQLVFDTFWEAWDELHKNFIGELNDQTLLYGAAEGMIRAAGDPYTVFSDPDDTQQFEETLNGSFSGIGVEIGVQRGFVTVIAPLHESPAEKAGMKAGDVIVAVDNETVTHDMSLDDVVRRIRGEKGTSVKLTVLHKDSRATNEITIIRDTIQVESVRLDVAGGIAHIRISTFDGETSRRFATIVKTLEQQNVQGVVLDMRGNPGGFLQAAVNVASHFVEGGKVVVTEKGKRTKDYTSSGTRALQNMPVVVLIDGGSASASEIVAGALRDQRQAHIVGVKSFGKGSVQEFIKLDDGSSLRVTVAKWFTPNGQSIHEEGIAPTIEVAANQDTTEDEQLDRAKEELKQLLK